MNHEYVLFSKNTCQNSMVNVLDKDKILWYVMRAYKNENTAEDRLSNETYGLEYFIPKQKVLRTVKGKKVFFMVPVIHSLVFVHASHQKIVDFKHNYYYDLQFVTWKSGGELVYLTVPDEDMTNFIKVCKQADAVLFSAVGDPKFDNDPTAKVRPEQGLLAMRKKLGLFANIRPVQTFKCLVHKSPLKAELVDGADFLCIRELTGGMYFGEKYQDNDKAYYTNMYTRPEIERILKVGFEYAMKRRKHLTVVDKAKVLASSRLWRQIAQEMAPQYPEVTTDYMFVDNAAMKMIQEPKFFDVMVTENTFGDILTDEGSCISGSMGLLPSASTGESTPVFEPIHGSWPQAKGLNIANPLAQILSVAMLFEYFGLKEEGALVREAVDASLDANVRTPEIQAEGGAKYGTKEVGAWIVDYIKH